MFDVTFNLSQRTKGVTQCLLLIINIHDLYIFTSNFFSSSSAAGLFEADLERREPQVFFCCWCYSWGCGSLSLFSSRSENWIFSKAELAATACQRSCCCRRRGCRLTSRLGSFSATTAHPPSRSRLTRRRRLLLRTPAHNAHTTPEGVSVFQKQNTSGAKMKHYPTWTLTQFYLHFPTFIANTDLTIDYPFHLGK